MDSGREGADQFSGIPPNLLRLLFAMNFGREEIKPQATLTSKQVEALDVAFRPLAKNADVDYQAFRDRTTGTINIFCNDLRMSTALSFLEQAPVMSLGEDVVRTALIIGEHNFATLLPRLNKHVQAVVFVDIDPLILAHNLFIVHLLRDCEDQNEFLMRYLDEDANPVLKAKIKVMPVVTLADPEKIDLREMNELTPVSDAYLSAYLLQKIKQDFGDDYFIGNSEAFERCQAAARRIQFVSAQANLFDLEQSKRLAKALESVNAQITVFGLTNLYLVDGPESVFRSANIWRPSGEFEKSMQLLLGERDSSQTHFLYSTYIRGDVALLLSKQVTGYQDYLQNNKRHIVLMNFGKVAVKHGMDSATEIPNNVFRKVMKDGDRNDILALMLFYKILNPAFIEAEKSNPILKGRAAIDVNYQDPATKRTVLHEAVDARNVFAVRCLLRLEEIDLSLEDQNGVTACQLAEDLGFDEVVALFSEQLDRTLR